MSKLSKLLDSETTINSKSKVNRMMGPALTYILFALAVGLRSGQVQTQRWKQPSTAWSGSVCDSYICLWYPCIPVPVDERHIEVQYPQVWEDRCLLAYEPDTPEVKKVIDA